jgi:two-component system, OmpR family, osmolarity sensor histidine kinase EnvZ
VSATKGSLALRIGLILASSLLLVSLAVAVAVIVQLDQDRSGAQTGLGDRVAGLAELVEATPPERLPLLLRVANSGTAQITVSDSRPAVGPDQKEIGRVPWLLSGYARALDGRPVQYVIDRRNHGAGEGPEQLAVGLRDGRWLVIARGNGLRYFVALRLGLQVLTLALLPLLLIGLPSLWILRRQLGPLEQVVQAVERFGEGAGDAPLKETGALEVRRLVQAFNRMQDRIRGLLDGRTRMFAAISHDLGTYLTRLRLRAEFIADPVQRDKAGRDIEEMEALMHDSLALAAPERDASSEQLVDFGAVVEREAGRYAESGAAVQLLAHAPARVRGRATALARVVSNLVGNALKHAGSAELSLLQPETGVVELRVEDRGPGIPASLRELVLEPFYRGDGSRNLDVPGFGLGLAIVAEIVRKHGGTLALEDRPGGGLRARVSLKAAE